MTHTRDTLKRDLAAMAIPPDATLLVHSSVKSVGDVDGRADAILDALIGHLSRGLLALPTLSWNTVDASHPRFSVARTPSCVGMLTELFRQRPGVFRSWHPTHSLAACGADAQAFVSGHERFDTPCARQSPWGRLVDRNGLALFIGCGIGCNTLIHGVEEWCSVPGRLTITKEPLEVETPDGRVIPVPSRRHLGTSSANYAKLEPLFLARGVLTIARFGDARCHLARIAPMVALVTQLLQTDIELFSHANPPESIPAQRGT